MTVMDLLNEGDRNRECWWSLVPLKAPIRETIAPLHQKWLTAAWPGGLVIEVKALRVAHLATLVVEPSGNAPEAALRRYPDEGSAQLGVRTPHHLTYGFHISLAYRLFELQEHEWAATKTVDAIHEDLRANALRFGLEDPEFCFFPDMSRFDQVRT